MYYSLMFDIELVTYAKVNFTKSTEKATDALQTREEQRNYNYILCARSLILILITISV